VIAIRRTVNRQICTWFGLAALCFCCIGSTSPITLVWVDGGGSYHDAVQRYYLDPWQNASGDRIVSVAGTNNAKLRAMVEAKRVEWDVYNGDNTWGTDIDGKWLTPLDYTVIPRDQIIPGFASKYRVANMAYSIVLAYNTERIRMPPSNWSDFFDLVKFPGKRGVMDYSAGGLFEVALMADGVAPERLYPLDVDRAIKKLDTIKSSLVFWQSGAQSEDLISSGEVAMVMMYNARAYDAKEMQKKPVAYTFNGQIISAAYLSVPLGCKHVEEAMKLIGFVVSKSVNGELSKSVPIAPMNKESIVYPPMMSEIPTNHLQQAHAVFDDQWISENARMEDDRYQKWKSTIH
jgi:putative spermidine/putrescine transport system substrate-binding protein